MEIQNQQNWTSKLDIMLKESNKKEKAEQPFPGPTNEGTNNS